jgi:multidrug resistance efflux pump
MNWKRLALGVGIGLLLIIAGLYIYRAFFSVATEAPELSATPVAGEVEGAAVVDEVDRIAVASDGAVAAEGQVVPLRQAQLAFAAAGQVAEVLAAEGTSVEAGAPILRLDTTDQELALTQAEAALAQAQANLSAAQAGLEASQVGVQAAEVGVQAADIQVALVSAPPRPEEIALRESSIAVAEARIGQASGAQGVVLEGSTAAQIQAAEADLQAAEARALPVSQQLSAIQAQENPDADVLAQAQRDYAAAQASIDAARIALDELRGGATAAEQQAASGGVAAAVAQREVAQAELDLLLAGSQVEQIAIAEAGKAEAAAALAEAQFRVQQAEAAVGQAQAGVSQAQAGVDAAQVALDNQTLTAPFAGTVADVTVELGEIVSPGVPAAIVADLSGWLVETTDLTELDVVAVAVDQTADVRADALPDDVFTGVVTDIASDAEEVRGDITYRVTLRLDDDAEALEKLRWGMTVFVTLDTEAQ